MNIKVYYSNSTNDVSWQFPLSQKESNTFNSLYHPRCAQGYLEFLPPNPSQCANANDIHLVCAFHDVQICEQKFKLFTYTLLYKGYNCTCLLKCVRDSNNNFS